VGGQFLCTEESKAVEDLENLLMAIIWIDFAQQKCDHSALGQSQFMVVIYFRLFLELDLVFQSCQTPFAYVTNSISLMAMNWLSITRSPKN
jgi:hypothetical protein